MFTGRPIKHFGIFDVTCVLILILLMGTVIKVQERAVQIFKPFGGGGHEIVYHDQTFQPPLPTVIVNNALNTNSRNINHLEGDSDSESSWQGF